MCCKPLLTDSIRIKNYVRVFYTCLKNIERVEMFCKNF